MSHLAISGEDGGDELRVGMPTPMKIADDGLNVASSSVTELP
jgi:hypothetical protein